METEAAQSTVTVRELSLPIHQSKGWIKLLGVLSIISGIFTAVTLVGILIAWLPIWIGVVLIQSASSIERAYISGEKEPLFTALSKLKTYFTIQGVLTLIGLIVAGIAFAMGMLGTLLGLISGS